MAIQDRILKQQPTRGTDPWILLALSEFERSVEIPPRPDLETEGKPATGPEIVLHLGLEVYTELIFDRNTDAETSAEGLVGVDVVRTGNRDASEGAGRFQFRRLVIIKRAAINREELYRRPLESKPHIERVIILQGNG